MRGLDTCFGVAWRCCWELRPGARVHGAVFEAGGGRKVFSTRRGSLLGRPPVVPELRGSHSEASGLIQAPGRKVLSLRDHPSPCAASGVKEGQRRDNERL